MRSGCSLSGAFSGLKEDYESKAKEARLSICERKKRSWSARRESSERSTERKGSRSFSATRCCSTESMPDYELKAREARLALCEYKKKSWSARSQSWERSIEGKATSSTESTPAVCKHDTPRQKGKGQGKGRSGRSSCENEDRTISQRYEDACYLRNPLFSNEGDRL